MSCSEAPGSSQMSLRLPLQPCDLNLHKPMPEPQKLRHSSVLSSLLPGPESLSPGPSPCPLLPLHDLSPNPTRFAARMITTIPTHSNRIERLVTPAHSPRASPTMPPNSTYPLMCSIQST